jgi:anaerobic selenocysteine-containing dehydrogenase
LCIGGNPLIAWPNQAKVQRALEALDLLVCLDIKMSQTSRLAHYVVAPQVSLERDDITILSEWWYEEPYARYTRAVIGPPPDTVDEWEFFWELARRLGTDIPTAGGPLPMDRRPTKFEVLEKITHGCRVPLARIRDETHDGGKVFPEALARVEPPDAGAAGRFQLAPAGVTGELRTVRSEALDAAGGAGGGDWPATHLLICRRSRNYYNSTGHDLDALRLKGVTNHAYMNAADLATLGVVDGDLVEIAVPHASILGVARATDEIRPGVVSMSHAFGDSPLDPASVRARGAPTNRLVNDEVEYDPITGQCRLTAIRVRVRRSEAAA